MNGHPLPVVLALVMAGLISFFTATTRDWDFIQRVGGIRVEPPVRAADGRWRLPVACDVSGLHAITTEPTLINSGLLIRSVQASVAEQAIYVRVVTCVASAGLSAGGIHAAALPPLKPGAYAVYYGRPGDRSHPLGVVRLAP